MQNKWTTRIAIPFIWLVVSALACNFGGSADETPTPVPPKPTATEVVVETVEDIDPTETAPPTDPLRVSSLEDVKLATVQIEAQGSFVDPQVGLQLNVAGTGSGFIVDERGIAVTNNHVVTGAALLRVWIGGEGEPLNARVLGVSECSDLAVIDIEGDGYHYMEWYQEPVQVGLDVYAAGFPLGDPEFTLTRGIVSKEEASGDTDWASVNSVIEHDATINPGNSGGPLVTGDGLVLGVNYASSPDYNQYFAITREEALGVIDQLRSGQDVASIGVNGTAVTDGEELSGIWVSSVKSGSPADRAGVIGGDIITNIEGLWLATDGTMADYCDILRSHHQDETMSLEVLRFDTEEVLQGQLNGDPLAHAFSFAQELGADVDGGQAMGDTYSGYMEITDDTGAIVVEVPVEWSDFEGSIWEEEGEVMGAALVASSDLDAFDSRYDVPGVIFLASQHLAQVGDAADLLDIFEFSDECDYDARYEYEDSLYSGYYDIYTDCGGTGAMMVVVAALPPDRSFVSILAVQVVSDADLDATDHILDTFVVVGDLPDEGSPVGSPEMGEVAVTVTNLTDQIIYYVYIAPSTSDSWGEDWLGDDILGPDDWITFFLNPGNYDLAVTNQDGDIISEKYQVAITSDTEWTIYYDEGVEEYAELLMVNQSGREVCFVRISPSTSDSWGDDWLGEDEVILDGESYTFLVTTDHPSYDLQALDCDGNVLSEELAIDIKGNRVWTVTP